MGIAYREQSGEIVLEVCPHCGAQRHLYMKPSDGGPYICHRCGVKGNLYKLQQFLGTHASPAKKQRTQEPSRIAAIYDYKDETGELVFQVVRYEPKAFRQRRPDGRGGWLWNVKDVRQVPYNIAEILKADTVYIVEGEKDVESMRALGLTATCNAGGAGKWRAQFSEYFKGRHCIILPDNDERGREHAADVAAKLQEAAVSVKIVRLPDLPVKADVSDWIAAGGTADELVRLCDEKAALLPAETLRDRAGDQTQACAGSGEEIARAGFTEKPQHLPGLLSPVAAFGLDLLPETLRGYVIDVAERMQVPYDFIAVPVMISLGAAIGRRLGIYPQKNGEWLVVPNLWGGIVAEPSMMKTPVFSEVLKFLYQLEKDARAQKPAFETEMQAYQAQLQALKKKLKKAAECEDEDELEEIKEKLVALKEPEWPHRYVVNDTTVEKLGELLKRNPAGLMLYRDELTGFLSSMGKPGREGDRQFYLEAWNGNGLPYVSERISRGTIQIDAPCVSLLGGIQPGPLRKYINQAITNGLDADGFAQRLQLLVYPDIDRRWQNIDRKPDYRVREKLSSVFQVLAAMPAGEKVPGIHFDKAAQERFNAWLQKLENELRSGEHPAYFVAHMAKYRSLMPSLALICHCVDRAQAGSLTESRVSVASVERAAAWCDYIKAQALRIYGSAAPRPEVEAAHALSRRIKRGQIKNCMRVRDIERAQWSKLNRAEDINGGLKLLQEYGWVIIEKIKPGAEGGRPSELIWLHPDFS